MSNGLDAIVAHVNGVLAQQIHPLYLVLDDQLRLRSWRGEPETFGLPMPEHGLSLVDALPLLATADPSDTAPQQWRFVELPSGHISHIQVLRLEGGWGIALLDAREEHAAQQSRQQITHELLLLRDERERLLTELEEANRLKTEFIGRMSHEFRTPLASVIGYTDSLRELRETDDVVQQHLGAVSRGARHLLNLIENLLDQARIELDTLTLNQDICDLEELCNEVELMMRSVAEQKSLSFTWYLDNDVPRRVWTDAMRLKQVLINLIGNAIKFTDSGKIDVGASWRDGRLWFSITDTGPGIADKDVAGIFDPFRQGGAGHQVKGAGLGLSISRTLVQAMGGGIRVTSEVGKGTRFEFDIVVRPVQGRPDSDKASLRDRAVLIVDDDPDLLALLALYLDSAGCVAYTADDVPGALAAVESLNPDVVVLDLELGNEDGAFLAARLRNSGYRGPLASLSAANDTTVAAEGAPPFDAQWTKPISRTALVENLTQLLR